MNFALKVRTTQFFKFSPLPPPPPPHAPWGHVLGVTWSDVMPYLHFHRMSGERSGPEELVDAVDRQEARVGRTQTQAHGNCDGVGSNYLQNTTTTTTKDDNNGNYTRDWKSWMDTVTGK